MTIFPRTGIIAFIAVSFAITRQWSSMWRSTTIVNPWFACVITKADFLNDWSSIDLFSDNRSVVLILSIYRPIALIVLHRTQSYFQFELTSEIRGRNVLLEAYSKTSSRTLYIEFFITSLIIKSK